MEDAISALRAERAILRARLAKIEAAISEYERWAESVSELIPGSQRLRPHSQPEHESPAHATDAADEPTASSIREFEEAARAVLRDADRPQQRGEMLAALDRGGIVVGGKDPANTLASRLTRMHDIVNLRGYGYWLKDRPYPQAGYVVSDGSADEADALPVSDWPKPFG